MVPSVFDTPSAKTRRPAKMWGQPQVRSRSSDSYSSSEDEEARQELA